MSDESSDERADRLTVEALAKDDRIAALVAEVENLHRAREHQAVIEQAKGVIMSSMGCGADAAFAVLVAQSQHENRKLFDVASDIDARQDRTGPEAP